MDRSARVERLLRKMDETRQKNLGKLRGSGAGRVRAHSDEQAGAMRNVFLAALAAVSDADLSLLEIEVGLSPAGPLPPGVPPPVPPRRRAARRRPPGPGNAPEF